MIQSSMMSKEIKSTINMKKNKLKIAKNSNFKLNIRKIKMFKNSKL